MSQSPAKLPKTSNVTDRRPGTYQHYKDHFYTLFGRCLWGPATDLESGSLLFVAVAHYSEDDKLRLMVMWTPRGTDPAYVCWPVGVWNSEALAALAVPLVFYRANYDIPGDTTPRHAIRPEDGPEGFFTPKQTAEGLVPRFVYEPPPPIGPH